MAKERRVYKKITEREILINGEWHVEQFEEEVNSSYFSDDEFDDDSDKSKKNSSMPNVSDNEPENTKNNDSDNEPANTTKDDSVDEFPYRCTQCGTGRETQDALDIHIEMTHDRRHHKESEETEITVNLSCPQCDKSFSQPNNVKRNMENIHNRKRKNADSLNIGVNKIPRKDFSCDICQK